MAISVFPQTNRRWNINDIPQNEKFLLDSEAIYYNKCIHTFCYINFCSYVLCVIFVTEIKNRALWRLHLYLER